MSGHSKWHKIKHTKAVSDQRKSKEFGKLARDIQIAARAGTDPAKNASLRDAIARAKKANMPQANIDRLLSRRDDANVQEVTYEAIGPGGSGLIIIVETDNPNRTVTEVRIILKNHHAQMGGPGSVRWKFDDAMQPKFRLPLSPQDAAAVAALEAELTSNPDVVSVYTDA